MKILPTLFALMLLAGSAWAVTPASAPVPSAAWFKSALPVSTPDLLLAPADAASTRGEAGTITTRELATSEPVLMALYEVKELPDRTYRELTEYATMRALLTPCVIFTTNLRNTKQLQFIGAPLSAIEGENPGDRHQARFPLVTLAW